MKNTSIISILFTLAFCSCSTTKYEKVDLIEIVIEDSNIHLGNDCYTKGIELGRLESPFKIDSILHHNNTVNISISVDSSDFTSNYYRTIYEGSFQNDTICINNKLTEMDKIEFHFEYKINSANDVLCFPEFAHEILFLKVGKLYIP